MISRFLFVVPSLMVACAAGAAECVWTGSTGDGGKWSTPGNWRGNRRPEAGDTVVFENASEVTTENDRDGLVLEKAWFLGSAMVTVNGNGFSLTADDGVWTNRCAMRVNVPVTFTGAIPKAVFENASPSEIWFNSPVCLVDDAVYYSVGMGTSYVYYKGGIVGPDATYMHNHEGSSRAYIYGGKLNYFRWNGASGPGQVSFLASVNGPLDVANPIMLHYGSPYVSNTGALSANVVLSWGDGYREAGRSTWDVRADQTLNRIESGKPLYGVNWVKDCDRLTDSNGSRTVTLRGTDNAETYGVIWGTTSITWDPVGDFTQTFLDRCHLNTGTLTVNRGTLASAGTNTFGNVSAVVVNGGSFKNTTVSPRSLASVKTLVIGGKGHFKLGPETPNPFTDGQIVLSVSSSATLDWPAGMTLSVKSARVDGLSLPVGKYTGKDGTDGEATKVGWISGGGVISVAGSAVTDNEWTGGIDTDWTVAGNWSEGVPSAALPANIYGGTSEIAKAISAFAVLNVGGLPAAAPLLQVKTDTMFDGVVTTIRNGGEIRAVNARMQFDQSAGLTVEKGGVLSATGSSVLRLDGEFGQTGGRVDIGGNSVLEVTNVFAKTVFKTGEVVFRDNAELKFLRVSDRLSFTPSNEGEMLKMSFLGNSFASSICDYWKLCDGKDASVELEIDTAGQVTVGHTLAVAASGRGQARVMIKRGTLYVDSYGIRLATGSQATGEMRVDGGVLDLASTANPNPAACGFVIGDGSSGNMSDGIHNGVVAISGGIVTNRNRTAMIVGIGRAKGLVRMSGGNVFHRSERVIVLGMQGAEGAWEMSGGTVNSLRDLYIGGCDKSLIAWAPVSDAMKNWVCPTGRMSISGGTFETSRDVIVSAEGKGELELSGTGVLSAANLILSNKVDSATTHVADLKFTTGADVCGSIRLSGRLAIGAGARLTVDASAFTGDRIQLVKAGSVEGVFDESNVSLVCPRSDVQLVTRRDGIVLKAKKGMILLFR